MTEVQADLVSMEHMPGTVGETTYKYVLSVIDVFSRFLILRPATSGSASEIADILTGKSDCLSHDLKEDPQTNWVTNLTSVHGTVQYISSQCHWT